MYFSDYQSMELLSIGLVMRELFHNGLEVTRSRKLSSLDNRDPVGPWIHSCSTETSEYVMVYDQCVVHDFYVPAQWNEVNSAVYELPYWCKSNMYGVVNDIIRYGRDCVNIWQMVSVMHKSPELGLLGQDGSGEVLTHLTT